MLSRRYSVGGNTDRHVSGQIRDNAQLARQYARLHFKINRNRPRHRFHMRSTYVRKALKASLGQQPLI